MQLLALRTAVFFVALLLPSVVGAQSAGCQGLPDHDKLKSTLAEVVKGGPKANGGLPNQEWAAIVNRDGIVCVVVFSGPDEKASGQAAN